MTPILLVANNEKKIKTFLKQFCKKNLIEVSHIFEIEPQNKEISIDQIREVKKQVVYSFVQTRLFTFYNFDASSYQAQNALLKTLEEHSFNIQFILVVSSLYDILPTIRSRCNVVSLKDDEIFLLDSQLKKILELFINRRLKKYLSQPEFQVKTLKNSITLFDQTLTFFRSRLEKDRNATKIIRKIITNRSLVLHNNVNPQYAFDRLLILIEKIYTKS